MMLIARRTDLSAIMATRKRYAAAVVGGGPAGFAAALGMGRLGLGVALVAPSPPADAGADHRTAALFTGSIELLRNLDAWPWCAGGSEPITAIRLIDDTHALLRAPEVLFTAPEIGLSAFGYNVPNAALVAALRQAALAPSSSVDLVQDARVAKLEIGAGGVRLALEDGSLLEAGFVVGADGRHSPSRQAARIATRTWAYPQSALVCSFAHERPHHGISTEFHRRNGPLTTVPMSGRASSLVWVEQPAEAERLARLDDGSFQAVLERQLQGLLGSIGAVGARGIFPLAGLAAERFAAERVALVGEAAHVLPPIGAQGLNLGLRDGAVLVDCLADALAEGRDPGRPETLAAYSRARHVDVTSRLYAVDLLNRSLLSDVLPVHLARGLGLHALKALGPLRRLVMREGLAPSRATPTLMQPDGRALLSRRRRRPGAAA
jgi:2-octaprenyl-6-methoxyphenol hydroxylase